MSQAQTQENTQVNTVAKKPSKLKAFGLVVGGMLVGGGIGYVLRGVVSEIKTTVTE